MLKKRTIALATVVVCLTAFHSAKQSFLETTENDLFYNGKFIDADLFNLPAPGKAYAYFRPDGTWEQTEVCSFQSSQQNPDVVERFRGLNLAGLSYNDAIHVVSGAIGEKFTEILKAADAERIWNLNKRQNATSGGRFSDYCIGVVQSRVNDDEYDVFIVDTVYVGGDTEVQTPFMVKFKPKPFVFEHCDESCAAQRATLLTLLQPSRLTRWKRSLIYIDRI
jgi:hypothetical protein